MKNFHLRIVSLCLFVAVIGLAASVYEYQTISAIDTASLVARSEAFALRIPTADLLALSGSADDLQNPAYKRLKVLMTDIRAQNSDLRFVYLVGKRADGGLFFYGDSEDPSSVDYSPPGQDYPEASPALNQVFIDGVAREDESSDRWGSWISAYAPIAQGTSTYAVLGVDRPSAATIVSELLYSGLPTFAALVLIIILVALHFLNPRRRRAGKSSLSKEDALYEELKERAGIEEDPSGKEVS